MSYTRREFLRSTVGASALLSLAPGVPAFLSRAAVAASARRGGGDTVLVVVQLSGGNDGLNTVVPYEDDQYGRYRDTLRLTASDVHKIGSDLGFHPEMEAMARLFKEGQLTVVQGVAYPNSDRNHEIAMRHWHTARPAEPNCQTGWLGRAIDQAHSADDTGVPGIFVGPITRPFALNAEKTVVPAIRSTEQWTLRPRTDAGDGRDLHRTLAEATEAPPAGDDNPFLDFLRRSAAAAYAGSDQVEAVLREAGGSGDYPPFQLAELLAAVAQLVRADLGIRMFFTELGGGGIGGFDNHANQRDNHAALLRQLSDSVAAFVDDLAQDGTLERVVLITFSEFGRTLAENGRRGTDHGAAAPMLLVGNRLQGGLVGPHPELADLDQGAPRFHTDFRRVYATVLDGWLGLDSRSVLGGQFESLDLFRA